MVQKYGIDEADKRYQQYVKKQSINSSGKKATKQTRQKLSIATSYS